MVPKNITKLYFRVPPKNGGTVKDKAFITPKPCVRNQFRLQKSGVAEVFFAWKWSPFFVLSIFGIKKGSVFSVSHSRDLSKLRTRFKAIWPEFSNAHFSFLGLAALGLGEWNSILVGEARRKKAWFFSVFHSGDLFKKMTYQLTMLT